MFYPVRLYNPHNRIARFDLLAAIGAPERPGVFEPPGDSWRDALSAFADHKLAAVDPPCTPACSRW